MSTSETVTITETGNPEVKHEYRRMATVFAEVAEHLGAQPTDQEKADWLTASRMIRAVDNLLDEDGVDDLGPVADDLFAGRVPEGIDEELASECTDYLNRLTPDKQAYTYVFFQALADGATERKQARTPKELADAMLKEVEHTATYLELDLTDDAFVNRIQFNSWLHAAAGIGVIVDGALDVRKDHREGLVNVKPSLKNSLAIIKEGLRYIPETVRGINPKIARWLINCTMADIRDRH